MEIFDNVVLACKTLSDFKVENIMVCDISKVASVAKYFVFATSKSNVHGRASANNLSQILEENGVEVFAKEGCEQSDWVVVDCYDFVVHIMTKDVREHYNLDKLWGEGKNLRKFETIEKDLAEKAKKAEKKSKAKEKTATKKETKEKKKEVKTTKKLEKVSKKAEKASESADKKPKEKKVKKEAKTPKVKEKKPAKKSVESQKDTETK